MRTKLNRISELMRNNSKLKLNWLMTHIGKELLTECFHALDPRKAVGIDQVTKEEYGKSLCRNLDRLLANLKSMSYRPQPVKEVLIEKGNGKIRPLGIACLEDKIVQSAFARVLECIYEPHFLECSFGFRPGRNCHQAIAEVTGHLYRGKVHQVIDVDLAGYFNSIEHEKLLAILGMRIGDKRFLAYIARMLRAGIMSESGLKKNELGTVQGSIISPILANIYAHHALDLWIERTVSPRVAGGVKMVRYCDDLVIMCQHSNDVERVMIALKGRLSRFGLKLNEDKTNIVTLNKWHTKQRRRTASFSFLGFRVFLGRSRKGAPIPKLKTDGKRQRRALKDITDWIKKARNVAKLGELWNTFRSKLRGHMNYYCVSHNFSMVQTFFVKAEKAFFKWINRRSQCRSFCWTRFRKFVKANPLPSIRTQFNIYTRSRPNYSES